LNHFHRTGQAILLLFVLLATATPGGAEEYGHVDYGQPDWTIGPLVGTYSGPSHEDLLLIRMNGIMSVMMGSNPDTPFSDFEIGTPVGAVIAWEPNPPIAFAATYYYSQYSAEADFVPHAWDSPRELTTNLHELVVSLRYSLSFVKSKTIVPYIGGGLCYALADSELKIDLINTHGVMFDTNQPELGVIPDQHFSIKTTDGSLGGIALAGVKYNVTSRVQLVAEMQGILGQIRQDFDYSGSLQHILPGAPASAVADPGANDLLFGAYQLDLNGLRLSLGLAFGL
jgi:hypothetical protein